MVVGETHHSRKPPYWIYPTGPRMQLSPPGHDTFLGSPKLKRLICHDCILGGGVIDVKLLVEKHSPPKLMIQRL